jgi:hypothetical protein
MVVLEFNQIFFLKKEEHFKFPIKWAKVKWVF